MEEELRKHLYNVTAIKKYREKSFVEKIKHFVSEIVIIVFAITLSIALHSWSEEKHQQKEADEFLTDLEEDIRQEKINQEKNIRDLQKATAMFSRLIEIDEKFIDRTDKTGEDIVFELNLLMHQFDKGNYEGFKSSGKIGFIKNKEIKRQILRFYEQRIPLTNEVEKTYNDQVRILNNYATTAQNKREMFLVRQSKVMFDLAKQCGLQCDTIYRENIRLIDQLLMELKTNKK